TYYYNQILNEFKNTSWQYTAALNNLSIILEKRHDYDGALNLYHKALAIARNPPDTGIIAGFYMNMGHVYRQQKKFTEAISVYDSILLFPAKSLGVSEGKVRLKVVFFALAECYAELDSPGVSLNFYRRAIELAKYD